MRFFSMFLILFSTSAFAFEGQPSQIEMLNGPAQIYAVELPQITQDNLVVPDETCEEACYRVVRFQQSFSVSVGELEYLSHRFIVKVDSSGRMVIRGDEPATLYLKESKTGTLLTIALNGRTMSCFGSSTKGVCTHFSVVARY